MKFDSHETDLYILPESIEERNKLKKLLSLTNWNWIWCKSDVQGHSWFGKMFIEIPFGVELKDGIIKFLEDDNG